MRTTYGGFWRPIKYDGTNITFVSTYPWMMDHKAPLSPTYTVVGTKANSAESIVRIVDGTE